MVPRSHDSARLGTLGRKSPRTSRRWRGGHGNLLVLLVGGTVATENSSCSSSVAQGPRKTPCTSRRWHSGHGNLLVLVVDVCAAQGPANTVYHLLEANMVPRSRDNAGLGTFFGTNARLGTFGGTNARLGTFWGTNARLGTFWGTNARLGTFPLCAGPTSPEVGLTHFGFNGLDFTDLRGEAPHRREGSTR